MVINDFFSHKICGFNRHFGILFLKMWLYSSVDLMSFSIFWGNFGQIFHATRLKKKIHEAGRGHYVVDGH